jgi:hypothetical protein
MMLTGSHSSEGRGSFHLYLGVGLVFMKNEFEKLPPNADSVPNFPRM